MTLESGSFIDDLVIANPLGNDQKSEGDDHIRLVKKVIKASFPNSTRAFYIPEVPTAKASDYTIIATDENALIEFDTTAASRTASLTAGAALGKGFAVTVMKNTSGANTVTIDPDSSETVNGAATLVISTQFDFATVMWDGTEWKVVGERDTGTALIEAGTLMLFQQTAAPTGWTKETTHNDKALRVVSGSVSSGGATAFATVFGAGKAAASHTLIVSEIPAHNHSIAGNFLTPQAGNQFGGGGAGKQEPVTNSTGGGGGHVHNLSLDLQFVDLIIASKD